MAKLSSARWWDEKKADVHGTLEAVFATVRQEAQCRTDGDEYHATLYGGSGAAAGIKYRSKRDYTYGPSTLPYNVCRSATDTLTAKIAKHRPLPQVLANRGDWGAQKKARKLTQFLEGEFYRNKVFEQTGKRIVRDAAIFGRGMVRVFVGNKRPIVERVHPWEVFVDDWDARYGTPRNLYYCRSVDRGVAIEAFGHSDAIKSAGLFAAEDSDFTNSSTVDRVDVLDAWHLCDAHDDAEHKCTGRHVTIVQGKTLVDEPWEHDFFPFATLNYSDPLTGVDGVGLVEILEGFQYEINAMSEKVAESHRMLGCSLIMVPDGAGIYDQQLRNGIGWVLHHKNGATPQVFQPAPVHPQTYQRLKELPIEALNESGVSQMAAQSQKPAGVQSGIALQTLDDIETERFIIFGRAYETWCLDVARLLLWAGKEVAEQVGEYNVRVPLKGGILEMSWKDVELEGYELRVFPTSLLPQQLGARLEKLQSLFEAQIIDRETFLRQLDAPDLAGEMDLVTAEKLLIDEMIEAMLDLDEDDAVDEEKYMPPSSYMQDPQWAATRGQQKLHRAWLDKAPEANLELIRRWILDCEYLIQPPAPPPAPPPPAPADMPLPPPPDMGAPPL